MIWIRRPGGGSSRRHLGNQYLSSPLQCRREALTSLQDSASIWMRSAILASFRPLLSRSLNHGPVSRFVIPVLLLSEMHGIFFALVDGRGQSLSAVTAALLF